MKSARHETREVEAKDLTMVSKWSFACDKCKKGTLVVHWDNRTKKYEFHSGICSLCGTVHKIKNLDEFLKSKEENEK